jgi:predicted ribosome quality control (RQC) complex YloA/Tae2 family protein
MHLHHFALRHLAHELAPILKGSMLVDCFSQNKEELVLVFEKGKDENFLRISCNPAFPFVSPVHDFRRAKKNLVSLFPDLIGRRVEGIHSPPWERLFVISMEGGNYLVAKMHGMQSNVIAMKGGNVETLFRNSITGDQEFQIKPGIFDDNWKSQLPEPPFEVGVQLKKISPVLDKNFAEAVNQEMGAGKSFPDALDHVLLLAQDENFYLCLQKQKIQFTLFPAENKNSVLIKGITKAMQTFVRSYFLFDKYGQLYVRISTPLEKQIKRLNELLHSAKKGITALDEERNPEEIGNLIMAQLHVFKKGAVEAEFDDYYLGDKIKVKLKPDFDGQQNATAWYQKAKKSKAKRQHLESQIADNEKRATALLEVQARFKELPLPMDLPLDAEGIDPRPVRLLENFIEINEALIQGAGSTEEAERKHPFLEFSREGFSVFVGRNAKQNDKLTFHFSRREDLWLHVKDSPGSHVIVRKRPGRDFPHSVIEFAASLAAGHSPRKTEGLVPVAYALRKYVRKPKGAAAGLVVVDREEVVLVEPLR